MLFSMKLWRIKPLILAAIFLILGVGIVSVALHALRQEVTVSTVETLSPGVDVELRGVRFSEMRSGVRKYLLEADSATYRASGVSLVRDIKVKFFDRDGRETMHLRAEEGDLAGIAQQVTLRGAVVLTGAKGFVLETDHLVYSKADDQLVTDAPVLLTSPQGRLSGRGLVLYPQKEQLSLLHDVHGEVGIPLAQPNVKRGDS